MKPKKPTKATFKSFIRKNKDRLYVKEVSRFNDMVDGVDEVNGEWQKVKTVDLERLKGDYEIIKGVWLVGDGRDYFDYYEDKEYKGIRLFNSCGRSIVAIKK